MAGRPKASTSLVNPNELLSTDELCREIWIFKTLLVELSSVDKCLQWLARRSLIRNTVDCLMCNRPASIVVYGRGIDGRRWSCRRCSFRRGVRVGSFFAQSHLALNQIVILVYCWTQDMPQTIISRETETHLSTVVDWSNYCRKECQTWVERQPCQIGGMDENGVPIVVEVDETKYSHRKYHRGLWRLGHWVFGAVERDSGRCFLAEIPDRKTQTLHSIIKQHILPGSHVISDELPAYKDIDKIHRGIYIHSVVNHQKNFVDPNDCDIHTQNIESVWMRAKRKLRRQGGTSRDLFPSYLDEFIFRNAFHDSDIFSSFLICLRETYCV